MEEKTTLAKTDLAQCDACLASYGTCTKSKISFVVRVQ